jgi:7,8-dihydropterin-6-yl-methyl-4-(beta-D-ribofuranosyl)aminobenzene 5'-phosphate synthase
MKLRITTVSENTANMGEFLAEWGLSILMETDEVNILLDTGRTISACHNADTLGIDLSKIDKIALSHGHYDHTGGLRQVLRKMKKEVEVIAHPDIWAAKYARRQGQADRYTGIPFQRQELESLGARFNLTTKPVKITDNIMTTGEVPMITDYEEIDSHLWVKEAGAWEPDKLADDLAIIINTELGLVVVLGCAHRGIINTLYHAQQLTGRKEIHTVLGGSHLVSASEERIWLTMAALKELGVQRLGLCHCTSLSAVALLAQEFGDKFFFNNTGTILEIP